MSGSSLKFFADAKASIEKLGSNLFETVSDENDFIKGDALVADELLEESMVKEFEGYCEKIRGVLEMVERHNMKVVFFGRTSNGKSTVINAMLKNKILPSGMGHTTNCFVQVEGTDDEEACLVNEEGEIGSIKSLGELASALSERRLSSDSLIRLKWPKRHCKLLREDVVFVDSPGIDLSADVDKWIDKFCLDADVFVLVVNAESTLMLTEKNFFHRVSTRLSKPNIFILNNRWDASSYEQETMKEVRQQHEQRCGDFLVHELQCIPTKDLPNRLFFVSAQETLRQSSSSLPTPLSPSSSPPSSSTPSTSSSLPPKASTSHSPQPSPPTSLPPPFSRHEGRLGCGERLREWQAFEDSFEQCISKTAVETKFSHHVTSLRTLNHKLMLLWQGVCHEAMRLRNVKLKEIADLASQLSFIQDSSLSTSQLMRKNIVNTSSELAHRMHYILRHELDNLPSIVQEFVKPFDPEDLQVLNNYKRDLNFFVEECLTRNLHLKFTPLARNTLCAVSKQLVEAFMGMLPEPKHKELKALLPSRDFEVVYNLECSKLCGNFQADLRFHFSLGISALFQRFTGSSMGDDEWCKLMNCTSMNASLLPFTSPSSLAAMSFVALISKMVGMRIVLTCTLLYAVLYTYERGTWNDISRREAYKQQYCCHANRQLGTLMNLLCSSCSMQVESELVHLYNTSAKLLEGHEKEMEACMGEVRVAVDRLDRISKEANHFSCKHEEIHKQLERFKLTYKL